MKQLSTEPYKGVRDFTPDQMRVQNYILDTMHRVINGYGYQEYTASILEDADLYRAKSGGELADEQSYLFTDRGGREVILRPEMTPTLARMIAAQRRSVQLPGRWYSIPNCFRYEKPQRGRLREFWQLNMDIFGAESMAADAEVISAAYMLLTAFGAESSQFSIQINNRKLVRLLLDDICGLSAETAYAVSKLIDRKKKLPSEVFDAELVNLAGDKAGIVQEFLSAKSIDALPQAMQGSDAVHETRQVLAMLAESGIDNAIFYPSLMRGLDYYTGIVFEVFDTGGENNRSLFGGGRYDYLVDMFGVESLTATGFGASDIVIEKFLETYGLLPDTTRNIDMVLCTLDSESVTHAMKLANQIRSLGAGVLLDWTDKKVGDKMTRAVDAGARFTICIGTNELQSGQYSVKNMQTGEVTVVGAGEIGGVVK
jgi:histidyl-tRNA synthetase